MRPGVSPSIAALGTGADQRRVVHADPRPFRAAPDPPGAAHRARVCRRAADRRPIGTRTGALDDSRGFMRWRRSGLVVGGAHRRRTGSTSCIQVDALMVGIVVLAYSNWSLTDRHYQAQTRRLRAVADVARRLGLTTNSSEVAAAVLGGCHETYPDATWGRVLLFDAASRRPRNSPADPRWPRAWRRQRGRW